MKVLVAMAASTLLLAALPSHAQWEQVPDSRIPRNSTGEADLSAPAPRTAAGKIDLSGVWVPDGDPLPEGIEGIEGDIPLPRHMINIMADMEPDEVELHPWAAELFQQRLENRGIDSPLAHCKPTGIPLLNAILLPFKIVQTDDLVLILYEENTVFRQIFLDGRKTVEDPMPRWMGYSTGEWDGNELVVETVGMIEDSWLDGLGHPHTEAMKLTERFRRTDAGHLEIETTIDDPETFSKPVTYTVPTTLIPDADLLEYFCSENEKSSAHYQ